MTLTFGFSPCPNDTFMFDAIVNKRIDLHGLTFDFIIDDVEHLNKIALNHQPDITKMSFNAFTKIYDRYQLLTSGAALGNNCGPLLIAKNPLTPELAENLRIAVPGYNTTAFLLLKYALPNAGNFKEYVFSEIENAILSGEADAGLIIHENRFTYQLKGLYRVIDLGEYWEQKTLHPIPLGGIGIKRSLPNSIKTTVNKILFESIKYAFDNPDTSMPFVAKHAQEMDPIVMKSHIDLYVNTYSQELGEKGRNAIFSLFRIVNPEITNSELSELFVE